MSSSDPVLRVEGLSAAWGPAPVLDRVSFDVGPGEMFVLLGPNGSGKTTLLRCVVGLERPTGGRVRLDGVDVLGQPVHRRGIGLMLQEAALFPHRTVAENIAYAPLLQHRGRTEVEEEVARQVELVGLTGFEDRRPDQLSGGERQRVALARTLAARPRLVLLDEPFAAIDPERKADLRAEFRRVLRAAGISSVLVTHDRPEGLFLGDRVGVLFDGRLERVGPPAAVFEDPGTDRVARFLGYNVVDGPSGPEAVDPRDLRLGPPASGAWDAEVLAAGITGAERLVLLQGSAGRRYEARGPPAGPLPRVGERVGVRWERSIRLRESPTAKEAKNEPGLNPA